MRRILWLAAAAILVFPASGWCQDSSQGTSQASGQASGQSSGNQQESLADAARKAREQKKEAPKAAKVFTNDDLPSSGVSTVGQAAGAPEAGAPGEAAAPAVSGNDEKAWRDRFAQLHHKLDTDKAELDVLQREAAVGMVQYYGGDPQKAMQDQTSGQPLGADYNKKTTAIAAKQKAVEADEQAISDAEDQLRKSGGDTGWAR